MGATAKLIAAIGLNSDSFKQGLASVKGNTEGLKKTFSDLKYIIAGTFTVGMVTSFIKNLSQTAAELNRTAVESNATFEGFQALKNAMSDSELSSDKLGAALGKVNSAMIEAQAGNVRVAEAFNALGISVDRLAGLRADEIFGLIADRVANSTDTVESNRAVFAIFEKELGGKMLPTLKKVGEEGFGTLTERMKDSGRIIDQTFADFNNATQTKLSVIEQKWSVFVSKFILGLNLVWTGMKGFWDGMFNGEGPIDSMNAAWDKWEQDIAASMIAAQKRAMDEIVAAQESRRRAVEASRKQEAENTGAISKAAADGEIEDMKRVEAENDRARQAMESARARYYAEVEAVRWNSMTAEEQLNALYDKRNALLEEIYGHYAGLTDESEARYLAEIELLRVNGEIEKRLRDVNVADNDLAKDRRENGDAAKRITEEQVKALESMQKFLKGMTDGELDEFTKALKKIHDAIKGLDFSGLEGLAAVRNFTIPNASVMEARQFGRALKEMADAMTGLQLPQLEGLGVLKGFKIPNESVMNARQFGNALAALVQALNNTPLDLAPLQNLADLFTALKGGTVQLEIAAPSRDQLTLTIPSGFDTRLASIDGHLSTLASLKGIIYS